MPMVPLLHELLTYLRDSCAQFNEIKLFVTNTMKLEENKVR
jgi:hypothetical protein